MAANGTLSKGSKPQLNGHTDPKANGHLSKMDDSRGMKQHKRSKRTLKGSIVSITARLLLWYSILTAIFRCPSSVSDLTDASPRLCKPYLDLRTQAAPFVEPYYDLYLASYVDTARPYLSTFNEKVYTPAANFAKENYGTYGAPRVTQLQAYSQREWDKTVKPQLDAVQSKGREQYNAHLHPHIGKATDAVGPYYETVKNTAVTQYHSLLVPTYNVALPYVRQGYAFGHYYTTSIVLPYARWTEATLRAFLVRNVWPRLRILYGDNVEPQLMRISERLGRYKDSKKIESVVDALDSSTTVAPQLTESASATIDAQSNSVASAPTTAPSAGEAKPSYTAEETKEKVANDLKIWQEKFAAAADKGSDDLEERVAEITAIQADRQANGVGRSLVIELEEGSDFALNRAKKHILSVVKKVPTEATEAELEELFEEAVEGIKSAGSIIKKKATNVRTWKQKYDEETHNLVHAATESTLDVIDNIRDLGLQEIGMRWAWMDGITYKDWQKYHKLKKTFDEWRNEVQARAFEHPGLERAKAEGAKQEDAAMEIAKTAAIELARLRNVAKWKIWAEDATEDFSDKAVPARVFKIAESVKSKVNEASEAVIGTPQGSVESLASVASESLADASASLSSAVVGKEAGAAESMASKASEAVVGSQGTIESVRSVASQSAKSAASVASKHAQDVASSASGTAESVASGASSAVFGSQEPVDSATSVVNNKAQSAVSKASSAIAGSQGAVESLSSVVQERAQSAASDASAAANSFGDNVQSVASEAIKSGEKVASEASKSVVGSQGTVESLSSVASKSASSVISAANEKAEEVTDFIKGSPSPVASQVSSSIASIASAASEAVESPKKVWGGAAAQSVKGHIPILDDVFDDDEDDSYTAKVQSLISAAGDKAADITDAINDALSSATATSTPGSIESITSLAGDQYEKAFSAVSKALYGTPQGTGESISSVASENYAAAVTAASYAIYGTPAPVLASLSSEAAITYSAALSAASSQLDNAKSRVQTQIGMGKKEKIHEQLLSAAEQIYSDSVAVASKQYAAAQQVFTTTHDPLHSISSAASSRLSAGLSAASAQFTSAKIAAGLQPTPVPQQYMAEARRKYYEGIGLAHARYSEFIEEASHAVYGTPTPAFEGVLSAAQSQYSAALSLASANLESAQDAVDATSRFNDAYAAATGALSSASVRASEAIYGSPQGVAESIASQISVRAESVASIASSGVIGTETPWTESVASQASQNWESLVAKASEQVYGQPTPFADSVYSQAGEYGAQATEAAAAQYAYLQSLVSELVVGKEPDFTESIMSRFNSAYSTGYPAVASSASSYASDAYASASSVVSSVFTPPPTLEAILDNANNQLNAAVDALSVQIYGTEKNYAQQATDAANSAYSAAQTQVSEAIYGTQAGYAEQAQASFADVAASAQSAISVAIYGTPTPVVDSATDAAASAYASVQSVLSENIKHAGDVAGDSYEAARAKVSSAIYGPEAGTLESAQARVAAAVESAKARLDQLAQAGGDQAQKLKDSIEETIEGVAERVRDEL